MENTITEHLKNKKFGLKDFNRTFEKYQNYKKEKVNLFFEENKRIREELKKINGLKVVCVFDRDKIGLVGSFTETEQHEGKLIFIESENRYNKICFLPKRHTKTGQILSGRFYYKELLK